MNGVPGQISKGYGTHHHSKADAVPWHVLGNPHGFARVDVNHDLVSGGIGSWSHGLERPCIFQVFVCIGYCDAAWTRVITDDVIDDGRDAVVFGSHEHATGHEHHHGQHEGGKSLETYGNASDGGHGIVRFLAVHSVPYTERKIVVDTQFQMGFPCAETSKAPWSTSCKFKASCILIRVFSYVNLLLDVVLSVRTLSTSHSSFFLL